MRVAAKPPAGRDLAAESHLPAQPRPTTGAYRIPCAIKAPIGWIRTLTLVPQRQAADQLCQILIGDVARSDKFIRTAKAFCGRPGR